MTNPLTPWADTHVNTLHTTTPVGPPAEARTATLNSLVFHKSRVLTGLHNRTRSLRMRRDQAGNVLVAATDEEQRARVWNVSTGEILHVLPEEFGVFKADVTTWPDGRTIVVTGGAQSFRFWDVATETCILSVDHTTPAYSMTVNTLRDGTAALAVGHSDGTIGLHDCSTGAVRALEGHTSTPISLAWAPESGRHVSFASASRDGTVRIWDIDTLQCLRVFYGPAVYHTPVEWIDPQDGHPLLAYATSDYAIHLWDELNARSAHTLVGHTSPVSAMAAVTLPSGQAILVSGAYNGEVRVWDVSSGECLQNIGHGYRLHYMSLVCDGDRGVVLAIGGDHPDIVIWVADLPTLTHSAPTSGEFSFEDIRLLAGPSVKIWDVVLCRTAEGRLLLAAGYQDAAVRVWDVAAGVCIRTFVGHESPVYSVSMVRDADGQVVLASGDRGGVVRVWYVGAGIQTRVLDAHSEAVRGMDWGTTTDGQLVLVTGSYDGSARVWGSGSDRPLGVYRHRNAVRSVKWATEENGRVVVLVGGQGGSASQWDPVTGLCVDVDTRDMEVRVRVAESALPESSLAPSGVTSSGDGGVVPVWEGSFAFLRTVSGVNQLAYILGSVVLPDGTPLVATGRGDGRVRIHDGRSGDVVHVFSKEDGVTSVCFYWDSGRLLLAAGGENGRTHLMGVSVSDEGDVPTVSAPVFFRELVSLGGVGMWPSLAVLSDLVSLTGTHALSLHDQRLRMLVDHPGVERLRELRWPVSARASFAALLLAGQATPTGYEPVEESRAQEQVSALKAATDRIGRSHRTTQSTVDIAAIAAAADGISSATTALLSIIGPEAASLDPLLPLRLIHHADKLPDITPATQVLLSSWDNQRRSKGGNAVSAVYSPGTADITRNGPITTLLPTQLALPSELFSLRHATGDLLHRHHPAAPQPPVRPVTIVLDTTPATFGPCEAVLRLVAHLVTTALWRNGHNPVLVTLTDPGTCRALVQPRDLLDIWTSRTLEPPDLATALATATTRTTYPVVVLTLHTAEVEPSAAGRLVTTHYPGCPPGRMASSPFHHHLDPRPASADVERVVEAVVFEGR